MWNGQQGRYPWEEKDALNGTFVLMKIRKNASTQLKDLFDEYADPDKDPSFHKTLIPVKLMEHEGDALISRSQAKRLISRLDRFTGVGQAFADQILRVFLMKHKEVHLYVVNASKNVTDMIKRVQFSK